MAGCNLSKGRGYFCGGQVGGIKKVFLANYLDYESPGGVPIIVTTDNTTGAVTDVQVGEDENDLSFYEFDLDRQLSSFNQTIVTGKGGAIAYQQDLELHMSHDSEESWMRMQNVAEGLWIVFVLDNNGVYYMLGATNGIEVSGGSYAHGGDVAYTDYVGYVISMTGAEPKPAFNFGTSTPFKSWTSGILDLASSMYNTPQI